LLAAPLSGHVGGMNKRVLVELRKMPIDQSIARAAKELATDTLLIAVKTPDPSNIEFSVASDHEGRSWVYAFTDEEEFSKTFPNGSSFVEMTFANLLATVGPDDRFGGIYINSKSDAMYLVPRELFAFAYQTISQAAA
jgi:hypothetical protein